MVNNSMQKNNNIFRLLVVAVALCVTAVSAFAQKQGTEEVNENMLRYRYVTRQSRKVEFSTPRSFAERFYVLADTGIEGLYHIENRPSSPGYAIGSHVGAGYWFTPLHAVEASLNFGLMPYAYWTLNFLDNPVIANTIVKNINLEANYVFNLTNYIHRSDKLRSFEFLYTAGANVGVGADSNLGSNLRFGINTSLRAVYNLSANTGLYLEPKVSYLNFDYVRPSISAGFTVRIKSSEPGYDKPVDNDAKKLLFALKTNSLFWIAGAPNFGIEYPINNRWSIAADYVAPWASSFSTGLYYQLMMINAEGRYWFGDRENKPVMTGLFTGLYAGGGYYDFMFGNTKTGIQGEFYIMAGATVGYAHSISSNDRLRLEYAIGLGYVETQYRKYVWDHFDYVLVAPSTQIWKTSVFGPTQAKVSLVWMLYTNRKGGKK